MGRYARHCMWSGDDVQRFSTCKRVWFSHTFRTSLSIFYGCCFASTGLTMSGKRCDSYPRVGNYPGIGLIPQSGGYLSIYLSSISKMANTLSYEMNEVIPF